MELRSIIGIKCSWDSCFRDYTGNPEGTPGARGRTRKCSGKTWGIEKQVDMNQVTPEEWIKDTGVTVQSQTFWGLLGTIWVCLRTMKRGYLENDQVEPGV